MLHSTTGTIAILENKKLHFEEGNKREIVINDLLRYTFELIEEIEEDTDIEELPDLTSYLNYDWSSVENNRHKINELVRAVNKMRKNT